MWSGQMREFIFKRQSKTKGQSYIVSSHIGGTSLASQFPAELLVWEHQKEKKKSQKMIVFFMLFSRSVVSDSLQPHGLQHILHLPELAETRPLSRWCPLLLPSIFPSIRVFCSELALRIRWPKRWSFSFSVSPSNEYSGLISFSVLYTLYKIMILSIFVVHLNVRWPLAGKVNTNQYFPFLF